MKKTRRITALLLAVIMVISLQATEIFAQQTAEVEQPSMWALEGIQWCAVYELAQEELYANYTSKVTCEELAKVSEILYKKITGEEISISELVDFVTTPKKCYNVDFHFNLGKSTLILSH